MSPIFLNLPEVIEIHRDQISRYGGQPGIRDMSALESALAMPHAGIRERYLHANLPEMAAAYLFHLVQNHPFIDGNKRTGAVAAIVFLRMNGVDLRASEDDLAEIVLSVAEGNTDKRTLTHFFAENTQ